MSLNCSFVHKRLFFWPAIEFIVNYTKGFFVAYLFVLGLIYYHSRSFTVLLAALATFAAVILFMHNIFLCLELSQDKLTGLDNKNSLYDYMERELYRVKRSGGYLTLYFFDIDNFKIVNDTYGHKVGDSVLIEVGKRIKTKMRNYDKLIRYGGDEFCVVCSQLKSESDCDSIQIKLQETLTFLHPVIDGDILIEASLGKATYPLDTDSVHGLVTIADQRMYEQKRNRKLARASLSIVNE